MSNERKAHAFPNDLGIPPSKEFDWIDRDFKALPIAIHIYNIWMVNGTHISQQLGHSYFLPSIQVFFATPSVSTVIFIAFYMKYFTISKIEAC